MFQKYAQILKDGIDALSSLHRANATFSDYLTAVGYEIVLLLLGLIYLLLFVFTIAAPFVFVYLVKNTVFGATKKYKQYMPIVYEVEKFSERYEDLVATIMRAENIEDFNNNWAKLEALLAEKGIHLDTSKENIDKAFKVRDDADQFGKTLPEIALYYGTFTGSSLYHEIHNDDNSALVYYREMMDKIFESEDDFKRCMKWNKILEHIECISFVIGYLILVIPFILMFVG